MENKLKKLLGLRKKDIRRMKKAGNFTLLELLIVVAILAVIAGGVVGAFTNAEENAAQSQAARDIAAVDQAVQTSIAIEGVIPDNVDSLLSNVITASATDGTIDSAGDYLHSVDATGTGIGVFSVAAAIDNRDDRAYVPGLGTDTDEETSDAGGGLAGKIGARNLTATQVSRLQALGLTKVRYIDAGFDDNNTATDGTIPASGGTIGTPASISGNINDMDIPQNYFNAPRPGSDRNRGRGFAIDVSGTAADIAANVQFAVWDDQDPSAPAATYDNVKVGAKADAVLVCFGIGPDCSIVGKESKFGFSSGAPYYANVKQNEYNNYIMLVDVSQNPAKVVAVIDTKGDFRAEEFSEYLDQKL